jgi:polynucleotide 5'-hydroxyl-kinase GRC3/NOL9
MEIKRLVILGQYEISVQKGQITILGSVLQASKAFYRVFAAASHALPVIRCPASDIEDTIIRIQSFDNGLGSLNGLSPLFGKLWNEAGPVSQDSNGSVSSPKQNSTFQIVSLFKCASDIAD